MSGKGSGRGGARPGAGRRKGTLNPRTRIMSELAAKVAAGETGETPLELMLTVMNYLRDEAMRCEKEKTVLVDGSGDTRRVFGPTTLRMMACEVAIKAAPFCHPKLSSIEASVSAKEIGLYEQSLLELAAEADS